MPVKVLSQNVMYYLIQFIIQKLVTRLINRLMVDGKRGKAATILYNAFDIVKENWKRSIGSFRTSNENIMPVLEVKARRVGF